MKGRESRRRRDGWGTLGTDTNISFPKAPHPASLRSATSPEGEGQRRDPLLRWRRGAADPDLAAAGQQLALGSEEGGAREALAAAALDRPGGDDARLVRARPARDLA